MDIGGKSRFAGARGVADTVRGPPGWERPRKTLATGPEGR